MTALCTVDNAIINQITSSGTKKTHPPPSLHIDVHIDVHILKMFTAAVRDLFTSRFNPAAPSGIKHVSSRASSSA